MVDEDTLRQDLDVEQDSGLGLWPDICESFGFFTVFLSAIVVVAGVKGSLDVHFYVVGILVSIAISALISLRGIFTNLALIRFRATEILLHSTVSAAKATGKPKVIRYEDCSVVETQWWRFRSFYSLNLYRNRKFVCAISDVSFGKSYLAIRDELSKRLPTESVSLLALSKKEERMLRGKSG